MTPEQLRMLKQCFSRIEPHSRKLSAVFYERFFAEAPQLRKLFGNDINAQHVKFMKVVAEMVRLPLLSFPATGIKDAEAYVPGSYWGGMLHGALGVRLEDFAPMKKALLWALVNCPEIEVTPAERDAWAAGYDVLVKAMSGGVHSWHVQEGTDEPETASPEPGQAFLRKLSLREDSRANEEKEGHPAPSLAAFLKGLITRGGPA
jgi:nitric oxide dioxygenase